jgi:AcrR family transcriptional regulator
VYSVRDEAPAPMSGRRAEAARNDQRILEAARAVLVADPDAPVSAVAERAGVGIGALYRRYSGKEEMLQKVAADGLRRYVEIAEAALADEGDPWAAFSDFMRGIVDARVHAITLSLAGTFTPTAEMAADARRADELNERLLERTRAAGAIRADIDVADLSLLFEQLAAIQLGDEERRHELRHRYLVLILDALRTPPSAPLPGPAPTSEEISRRWFPAEAG